MGDMKNDSHDMDEVPFRAAGENPAGDDADASSLLAEAVASLGPVPEPPREAIWAAIDAERAGRRARGGRRGWTARRAYRVLPLVIGLAAMLVIGIGIGRGMLLRSPVEPSPIAAAATPDAVPLPYRLAAAQHLSTTEALLAELPIGARVGRTDELADWAADLLTRTRLLLDSPAGDDPELARLLGDLELLLAQIATLAGDRGENEIEMIQDGMERNDVMLRLRTVAARAYTGT
jgi:hypothetical protein